MVQGDARRGRLALGGQGMLGSSAGTWGVPVGSRREGCAGGTGMEECSGTGTPGQCCRGSSRRRELGGPGAGQGAHSPREQREVAPWVRQRSLWVQGSGTDGQEGGCDPS